MIPRLLSFSANQDNAVGAAWRLVRRLHIPVTLSSIKEFLLQHPDYPSLLSISDALKSWKTENTCVRISIAGLTDLQAPFIVHLKRNGGLFAVVEHISKNDITYNDPAGSKKQITQTIAEFEKEWSGVVLIAEANDQSGEKNYAANRRKEIAGQLIIPFINTGFLVLAIAANFASAQFSAPSLFISLITLAGSVVCSLLLWFEADQSNPVLQQICSAGKHTNCKAVLQSKQSNLFGLITWSEIGFFYFAGSFLCLLINPVSSLQLLAWLNLVALPYTIFSVYYQWRVAKQWCPLCLAVQTLLVAEFMVFYFSYWNQYSTFQPLGTSTLYCATLSFLLPVFFWAFTKKILISAKAGEKYKTELNRLKHNAQIFEALLQKQKKVEANPQGLGITIGNPGAANTIIKVCNPYCGPCAKAHPAIEELVKENGDVKVQIIFTATGDEKDKRSQPVKHLMALYEKNDARLTEQALDDWYLPAKKDYETFAAKHPLNGEVELQAEKLKAMSDWCNKTAIAFTPTFFVNGYQLPEMYSVTDLKYFLAD